MTPEYACSKCGTVQKWDAWSGRQTIPLKCSKCGCLTVHVAVPITIKKDESK